MILWCNCGVRGLKGVCGDDKFGFFIELWWFINIINVLILNLYWLESIWILEWFIERCSNFG